MSRLQSYRSFNYRSFDKLKQKQLVYILQTQIYSTAKTVLRDCSRTKKMWPLKTGGFLTRVNSSEKCTLGDLKGRSRNTGGLKDRFDYTLVVSY